MRLRLLAILAVFVWIPSAQAGITNVWFEAVPTTPDSAVVSQGPGQTLELWHGESSLATYSWQVSMKAALGPGGIVEWSLDLLTAPGNGVSIVNPQLAPGNPFTSIGPSPGVPGSGPSLLKSAHGSSFTPIQPQTLTLLTFTLRRTLVVGNLFPASVFGGSAADASWVWANNTTGDYEVVQFGPNPPVPAVEGTVGSQALIRLSPVPEPYSVTLLALGAAVCLRRRRGVRSAVTDSH